MVFHRGLLSTKDPGPVCDNIYVFRLLIFEKVTTVAELINLCITKELQNSKQSVLLE